MYQKRGLVRKFLLYWMANNMKRTDIAWFAGLIDGEGWFTVGINKGTHTIQISPTFGISLKQGKWSIQVSKILKFYKIPFNIRKCKNSIVIRTHSWDGTIKVCKLILPYSVVKRRIIKTILEYYNKNIKNKCRQRYNQNTPMPKKIIRKIAQFIDETHKINKGKNRVVKWTGQKITEYLKLWHTTGV